MSISVRIILLLFLSSILFGLREHCIRWLESLGTHMTTMLCVSMSQQLISTIFSSFDTSAGSYSPMSSSLFSSFTSWFTTPMSTEPSAEPLNGTEQRTQNSNFGFYLKFLTHPWVLSQAPRTIPIVLFLSQFLQGIRAP